MFCHVVYKVVYKDKDFFFMIFRYFCFDDIFILRLSREIQAEKSEIKNSNYNKDVVVHSKIR